MDREALVKAFPSQGALDKADRYHRKVFAENALDSVLRAIEEEGRQPTPWESTHFWAAMGAIHSHMYYYAITLVAKALAEEGSYTTEGPWRVPEPPEGDLQKLRDALIKVSAFPA